MRGKKGVSVYIRKGLPGTHSGQNSFYLAVKFSCLRERPYGQDSITVDVFRPQDKFLPGKEQMGQSIVTFKASVKQKNRFFTAWKAVNHGIGGVPFVRFSCRCQNAVSVIAVQHLIKSS